MKSLSQENCTFTPALPLHHRQCPNHMAFRRTARQQSYRLRIQSASISEQTEKNTATSRKKTKEASPASTSPPNGGRRRKKAEKEEEAPKPSAEAQPESPEKQELEDEEGNEAQEWTANEYWQAMLEMHSKEEIIEEILKMEQEGELQLPDEKESLPMNFVARPGCTPFEFVDFSKETIEHDVDIVVEAPIDKVYKIWSNRLNYNEWFDLIGQLVLHTEEPELASYFLFYKWGKLPTLELYTTMKRSMEENQFVTEQSVDGMPLAIGAYFSEVEHGTEVTLRVSYRLPENLRSYVGPVGVWGDVNDILQENLVCMKGFVEGADMDELNKARQESQAEMDHGLEETNKTLDIMREELRKEGVGPEEGSPAARAEMLNILEEMGYDSMATVMGDTEPSWWKTEQAARKEAASSSAAASAEAAAQQRQDQRQMQAEADAEGRSLKRGSSTHPEHANLAQQLTKEFLEENMHKYTQKEIGDMFNVGSATVSRYVRQYGLKWPPKRKGHKGPLMSKEKIPSGTESDGLPAVEDPAQQEN